MASNNSRERVNDLSDKRKESHKMRGDKLFIVRTRKLDNSRTAMGSPYTCMKDDHVCVGVRSNVIYLRAHDAIRSPSTIETSACASAEERVETDDARMREGRGRDEERCKRKGYEEKGHRDRDEETRRGLTKRRERERRR